jgi:transcriptional regulator with XRE-family HTH domain
LTSSQRRATFGGTVRELRTRKQISLRKFAERVGVSATYLSKIERDEFKPPSREKIKEIADALGQDQDEMLALAEKTAPDLELAILTHPKELAAFLRVARKLSQDEIEDLTAMAKKKQ